MAIRKKHHDDHHEGHHECHCEHMEARFGALLDLIENWKLHQDKQLAAIHKAVDEIKKTEATMAQTMQDVQDALATVTTTVDELKTSVDTLVAQGPEDTTPIVTAIVALNDALVALKAAVDAKLTPQP